MFRSLSLWLNYVIAPNTVLLIILPSLLFFSLLLHSQPPPSTPHPPPFFFLSLISAHVCVRTSWICLRGEEGGTKSVERTWQLLFSLPLHCFGPSQILFHGAKHPLPGISTASISRRRFKPLSWHPDWAWREKACDAYKHRQRHKHTYYLCSERDWCPAVLCTVLTHTVLVSRAPFCHVCPPLTRVERSHINCHKLVHSDAHSFIHQLSHSSKPSHTKHTQTEAHSVK